MRVNVDSQVVTDPRFKKLGRAIGASWYEALGRAVVVWMESYSRRTAVFELDDVDAIVDLEGFGTAMARAGLGDIDIGGATIRLRGVNERIEFLLEQSQRGRRGGTAKRERPEVSGAAIHPDRPSQANATPNAQANATANARANAPPNGRANAIANGEASAQANAKANAQAYSPDLDQSPDQDHPERESEEILIREAPAPAQPPDALSVLPSAWEPEEDPESMRIAASARARGVDVERELVAFRQKARSLGWTRRNSEQWQSTWNGWLVQAKPHGRPPTPQPSSNGTASRRIPVLTPSKQISDDEREECRRMASEFAQSRTLSAAGTAITLDREKFDDESDDAGSEQRGDEEEPWDA